MSAALTFRHEVDGAHIGSHAVTVPISSVAFYRRYTELLLRRYMQVSMRMGRVPSVLGSCMFRGKVSSYRIHTFEDAVIFVYDIGPCWCLWLRLCGRRS